MTIEINSIMPVTSGNSNIAVSNVSSDAGVSTDAVELFQTAMNSGENAPEKQGGGIPENNRLLINLGTGMFIPEEGAPLQSADKYSNLPGPQAQNKQDAAVKEQNNMQQTEPQNIPAVFRTDNPVNTTNNGFNAQNAQNTTASQQQNTYIDKPLQLNADVTDKPLQLDANVTILQQQNTTSASIPLQQNTYIDKPLQLDANVTILQQKNTTAASIPLQQNTYIDKPMQSNADVTILQQQNTTSASIPLQQNIQTGQNTIPAMPQNSADAPVTSMSTAALKTAVTQSTTVPKINIAPGTENMQYQEMQNIQLQSAPEVSFTVKNAQTANTGNTIIVQQSVTAETAPETDVQSVQTAVPSMQGNTLQQLAGTNTPALKNNTVQDNIQTMPAPESSNAALADKQPQVLPDTEQKTAFVQNETVPKDSVSPEIVKTKNRASQPGSVSARSVAVDMTSEDENDTVPAAVYADGLQLRDIPQAAAIQSAVQAPAVENVSGLSINAASSRTHAIAAAVEQVCEAILVSPGLVKGDGEIRMHLKADVLDGTMVRMEAVGTNIKITFHPVTSEAQSIIEKNIVQFEQHLAGRIHSHQIAVTIARKEKENERV